MRLTQAQDYLQRFVDRWVQNAGVPGKLFVVTPETLAACPKCEAKRRRTQAQLRDRLGSFTVQGRPDPEKRKGKPPVLKDGQPQPRDERGRFVTATPEVRRCYREYYAAPRCLQRRRRRGGR
jgi:hypothetical protein